MGTTTLDIGHYGHAAWDEASRLDYVVDLNLNASPGTAFWFKIKDDWAPSDPLQRLESEPNDGDGSELVRAEFDDVTEEIPIVFGGTSVAQVKLAIRALNRVFMLCRRFEKKKFGRAYYVRFGRSEVADDGWISRIKDGKLSFDGEAFWRIGAVQPFTLEATLTIVREHYWEEDEDRSLQLTNGAGTGTTLQVFNHNDGDTAHDNWVRFTPDGGDMEAPLQLVIANNFATDRIKRAWVSLHELVDAAAIQNVWEGEALSAGSTGGAGGATIVNQADATCSGGSRADITWTPGSAAAEVLLGWWRIQTSVLDAYNGRDLRMLLRFQSQSYTDLWLRPRILYQTNVATSYDAATLWKGKEVKLVSAVALQDIGVVKLPPIRLRTLGYAEVDLCLFARAAASAHTIGLDNTFLLPTDGIRRLDARSEGVGFGNAASLIDDSRVGEIYTLLAAGKLPGFTALGEPLACRPGVQTYLYFNFLSNLGNGEIARTANITVKTRYRRRTIGS